MSHINLDLQASHKMLTMLDEANANTESVIDLIPGIFLVLNQQHEVLRANQGFLDLYGFEAEDIFRVPLARFFGTECWKIFAHNIRQVLESEEPCPVLRFEMSLSTGRDNTSVELPFHWTLTRRIVKNRGEGRLAMVFGDDISEMREAERRLSKVFTSIPLGIFTLNREGHIGDSYSSFLETMLARGKLSGALIDDVLFGPAKATMSPEEIAGIGAIHTCLGRPEFEYGKYARAFPQQIYHQCGRHDSEGRWLRITYQPIVFEHIVEQLLIILEDRTAIVNAEREMLDAARDRENSLALQKQSLELYESAIRDPLTGLYTRLYMKDAVAALLWSHDHQEIPEAALAIFDIDHFKKVNDTYGHQNGDFVLATVGRAVLAACDDSFTPIRFGGEEFVVFLPAGLEVAAAFAERVREAVQETTCALAGCDIRVTVSCGIALHRRNEPLDDLMHRADQLLYAAKTAGRNCIRVETTAP
jgi:two-component system, cell cycle response regulator